MGVDLKLLPVGNRGDWVSWDLWEIERRRELWGEIAKLGEIPVGGPVWCYLCDKGYGPVTTTPYGDNLTWLSAGTLVGLSEHAAVQDSWRNRAIWAALKEMPEDWPIVLYWH